MNLKKSFNNAKHKVKEDRILTLTAVAVGLVVYFDRKLTRIYDEVLPGKTEFSMCLSGGERKKIMSGIPKDCFEDGGVEVVIATKDMLKENFQELLGKTIYKD